MKGYHIEELTYEQVKPLLNEETIVVLPIGGGSKEHAAHLPMGTDMYLCQYLADQVTERCEVITLPILCYAHFPAFVEWKGSVNVESRTFIDVVKDICISFARHGVRKFLVIDFSISSKYPLYTVATEMNNEWNAKVAISLGGIGHRASARVLEQSRGGHSCEWETSLMLHVRPDLVEMDKAEEEYNPVLHHTVEEGGIYVGHHMVTKSGVNGNPLLANEEKGKVILEDMVNDLVTFVEGFRQFKITTY